MAVVVVVTAVAAVVIAVEAAMAEALPVRMSAVAAAFMVVDMYLVEPPGRTARVHLFRILMLRRLIRTLRRYRLKHTIRQFSINLFRVSHFRIILFLANRFQINQFQISLYPIKRQNSTPS